MAQSSESDFEFVGNVYDPEAYPELESDPALEKKVKDLVLNMQHLMFGFTHRIPVMRCNVLHNNRTYSVKVTRE